MFFKKTTCPNCNARHDEMLDYCPFCGVRNEANSEFKARHPMTFIPWYKELILALVGLIGFTLLNLSVALILRAVMGDSYLANENYTMMLVNSFSYLFFFLIAFLIVIPYLKDIVHKFKIGKAYLFGLFGFLALIGAAITIGMIIKIIRPDSGQGGNQTAVTNMVVEYPLISIVIIGLIGPICEELAYRVGLFSLLRRVHPSLAYIATALIFGFIHFDFTAADIVTEFLYLPEYMFAGLCFSFIYEKKGLAASTFAHVLNNMFSIMMILTAQQL